MGWKVPFVCFEFFAFQVDGLGTLIASIAAGLAGAYGIYLKSYEGSFKQQLDEARRRIAANEKQLGELSAENDVLRKERGEMQAKLAERDESIRSRDETIRRRDISIDETMRLFYRLSGDTADMAEAFLIRKGDAKSRANP